MVGSVFTWLLESRIRLASLATLIILGGSGAGWWLTREEPPTVSELLRDSLALLDDREEVRARDESQELARQIQAMPERDPDFPGGAEFVLGIVWFRNAQESDESTREPRYLEAIRWLKQAEHFGLDDERRAEWSLAMGTSLHYVGASTAAQPLLEAAVVSAPYGRDEAMSLLIDVYLDLKKPEELGRALELGLELTKRPLSPAAQDRAWLQLAQVYMAVGQPDMAEEALKAVSERSWTLGTRVFNAQTRMARREYGQAFEDLERVAADTGLERTFPRQASYLMGVCAENQGDLDAAINYYERTWSKYEKTHEAVAAQVRAGGLLRRVTRNEQALSAYRASLRSVRNPDDFRNRWLTIEEFRKLTLDGWNGWVENGQYEEAIALSRSMKPLFTEAQARELEARARQRRAETANDALAATNAPTEQARDELYRLWLQAGDTWASLAELQKTETNYPDLLWLAAEAYRRSHRFRKSYEMLDAFLATNPKRMLALGLVRRAKLLVDLDRPQEAQTILDRVMREFPTDPATFEAHFLAGICAQEASDLPAAESLWRGVLSSPELTPDAEEWRNSLFALGRLLCFVAEQESGSVGNQATPDENRTKALEKAYQRWEEGAVRLDEFLRRYPNAPDAREARYLLARALRRGAQQYQDQIPAAATENARIELQRIMDQRLDAASRQIQQLRTDLMQIAETRPLDTVENRLLAASAFELAHTLFSLRQYEQAIVAYNGAMNRHPLDPAVFLACLQLSECYQRLGRPYDARSMVQQARILLGNSSDDVFRSKSSSLSRADWASWVQWADQVRKVP